LCVTAFLVTGMPVARGETPSWNVDRVAGTDRYDTAARLSIRMFPDGAEEIVVASGERFADALAAGPAAARRQAPLLLTQRTRVPRPTADELRRLNPRSIVIAGGRAAVSDAVEFALATIAPVTRIAGADRFATSAKLATDGFGTGVPVAFLANGRGFADALAAGAVGGRLGGPVLLVEHSTIPTVVADAIDWLRPARIVLVGGSAATSDALRTALLPHEDIDRVGGGDRFATAAALAREVPGTSDVGLVASGLDFPDALAAAPSVAASGGTLALTGRDCLSTVSAQGMVDDGVEDVVVVGGDAAVPDRAVSPCGPVTASTTTSTTTSTSTTTTTTAPVPVRAIPTLEPKGSFGGDDFPDPAVVRVGTTWFAYSTQVLYMKVPVRSSTDLVTWTQPAEAFPTLPVWAQYGANWAPSVVNAGNGTFVMWYVAQDAASGRQCVSRAVATNPAGPFVDELSAAPVCQLSLGGSIDPQVFTDRDGTRWLYWKSDENALGRPSHIWAATLSADARSVTGSATPVLAQTASWEKPTIEQPSVVRIGEQYYLFYSGGWWDSPEYGVGIAVGLSPAGPFTKLTDTGAWLASSPGAQGPGGLDVFEGPDGGPWVAYHAWGTIVGWVHGGSRTTHLAVLKF
jgi:putative cell wall-binding protein